MNQNRKRIYQLLSNIVNKIDVILLETPTLRTGLTTYRVSVFQKSIYRIELLNHSVTQWFNELSVIAKEEVGSFNKKAVTVMLANDSDLLMLWTRCQKGAEMLNNEMLELELLLSKLNEFNQPLFEQAKKYEPALTSTVPKVYGKRR